MTSLNPFLHIIHDLLQVLQELLFIVHPFETTTLNVPTESKTCNTDVSRADLWVSNRQNKRVRGRGGYLVRLLYRYSKSS